jgi:hypothetical protein
MSKKLYILACVCDEGFDGPEFIYSATSRLEVAEYMLAKMKKGNREGQQLINIMELGRDLPEDFSDVTPAALLKIIDGTYVDGSSRYEITLTEYDLGRIIDI